MKSIFDFYKQHWNENCVHKMLEPQLLKLACPILEAKTHHGCDFHPVQSRGVDAMMQGNFCMVMMPFLFFPFFLYSFFNMLFSLYSLNMYL